MSSNLAFIRSIPPCAQMSHSLSVAKTRWSSKEGCTLNTWTYPSRHPSYKSRLRGDFHEAGPILAGVHGLNPAVHLGVSFGHILMLTHPDGLPGTQNIQNLVDIRASEHVTVHED